MEVDSQEEADHDGVVGWKLAAMMQMDVKAAEKLWMELWKETAELDAEYKEDEVDLEAAWRQGATCSVPHARAKNIQINARSMRWLNAYIKQIRNLLRGVKMRSM